MPKADTNIKILVLVIALLTISVFLPALQNDFVNWDDPEYVYENPYIKSIDLTFFKWALSSFHAANWHPLTWLSHALDYAVWGLDPMGHHLTSIVLHGLNTFLVIILVIRIIFISRPDKEGSALAAGIVTGLLFGLHPLHVESVAWISERKDVLCAFFILLSILAYLRYASPRYYHSWERAGEKTGRTNYIFSLVFFVMALMSKPMAVTLPVILIILDFYPLERLSIRCALTSHLKVLMEKIPFLVLSLALAVITVITHEEAGSMSSVNFEILGDRIIVAIRALSFYLLKILWPTDLAPFYPYPRDISFFTIEYFGAFLLATCITVFCLLSWKRQKVFATAWAYYIVILLPVLGIVASGGQAAADRYTYLPSIGPFILIGLGAGLIYERAVSGTGLIFSLRKYLLIPLILVTCLLSVMTVKQIKIWKDSMTLWNRQLELHSFYIAYNNRGNVYSNLDKYQKALADYNKAIEMYPERVLAYNNRGNAYSELEKYQEAIADFDKAIELKPASDLHNNRGNVYSKIEENENAIADYNKAIELDPYYASAYNNRGNVYLRLEKYQRAIADFDKAIELRPDIALLYNNRGNVYSKIEENKNAIADYNKAIELDPYYASVYTARGDVYLRLEKYQRAIVDFDRAIELNPNFKLAYNNRGMVYAVMGDHRKAIKDFTAAIEINSKDAAAYENRGNAYKHLGENAHAEKDFQTAERLKKAGEGGSNL